MYTYIPEKFNIEDQQQIFDFIENNSFATVITNVPDKDVFISHVPVILEKTDEPWALSFHLANNNQHCQMLKAGGKSIVVFKGPHAYVSPSWYGKKPGVPTWNYVVAHIEGQVNEMSPDALVAHVKEQVSHYEPALLGSDIMPNEFVDRLSGMISGFTLTVDQALCKFKLGQNRPNEDQQSIKQHLQASECAIDQALAAYMS
ncbi:MAG: FMN-binding negative transcriptional regulator [Algicola sp.]|nr:FMN-binding negative transcriptional regulator [Algicola sp.]